MERKDSVRRARAGLSDARERGIERAQVRLQENSQLTSGIEQTQNRTHLVARVRGTVVPRTPTRASCSYLTDNCSIDPKENPYT